ncbi:MAG TPA: hypothetical protein VGE50_04085 [Gammaproteobacteria bacterium]
MTRPTLCAIPLAFITLYSASAGADDPVPLPYPFSWSTVVNNNDYMPTDACDPQLPTAACRHFNSYNQPSVNAQRLVVIRARSRGGHGGGQPVHGVYTRDMATAGPVVQILDRATQVPQPNNLATVFHEPPSFPRIDSDSATLATRGNHPPVWRYFLGDGSETRAGTTGIYTNPFGPLVNGVCKLGGVADFSFFQVPEAPGTFFDVFPGAPAVTDGATLVFKGNYTVGQVGKTGVYYRDLVDEPLPIPGDELAPAAGTHPVILIANNTDSLIPGTSTRFGSTAPPSAAGRLAVFSGFDNEEHPTLGGIYLAPLNGTTKPPLTTLVSIGGQVPGEKRGVGFTRLGEGLSFDGRFVAFWGAWGTASKTLRLQCPSEGNAERIAFCQMYFNNFEVQVPLHQGIFVHDIRKKQTLVVAKTPSDFDDFLFWNFSGHVPGSSEGDDGEPARWRASAFAAVSGRVDGQLNDANFHTAFKARSGEVAEGLYVAPLDGIYLRKGPGSARLVPLIEAGMDGTLIDPQAMSDGTPLPVTEMGLERDGFRGNALAINATMGSEETGMSGVYISEVPDITE